MQCTRTLHPFIYLFILVNESLDSAFEGNEEVEDEMVNKLFDEIGLEAGSKVSHSTRHLKSLVKLCLLLDTVRASCCQRYESTDTKGH